MKDRVWANTAQNLQPTRTIPVCIFTDSQWPRKLTPSQFRFFDWRNLDLHQSMVSNEDPCWLHNNQFTLNQISKLLTFKWGQMLIDLEGCFGRSAGATPLSAVKGGKTSAMQSDIIARLQREQILYCRHRRSPPRAGEADFRSNRAALIARHKNSQQGSSDSLDRAFGFLGLYNTTMK